MRAAGTPCPHAAQVGADKARTRQDKAVATRQVSLLHVVRLVGASWRLRLQERHGHQIMQLNLSLGSRNRSEPRGVNGDSCRRLARSQEALPAGTSATVDTIGATPPLRRASDEPDIDVGDSEVFSDLACPRPHDAQRLLRANECLSLNIFHWPRGFALLRVRTLVEQLCTAPVSSAIWIREQGYFLPAELVCSFERLREDARPRMFRLWRGVVVNIGFWDSGLKETGATLRPPKPNCRGTRTDGESATIKLINTLISVRMIPHPV